jgi:hypothetical protein
MEAETVGSSVMSGPYRRGGGRFRQADDVERGHLGSEAKRPEFDAPAVEPQGAGRLVVKCRERRVDLGARFEPRRHGMFSAGVSGPHIFSTPVGKASLQRKA